MTIPAHHDAPLITAMAHAWQRGMDAAKAIKPGDLFMGARPAAEREFKDEALRRMFVNGYLYVLEPRKIITTRENIVISID